MEVERGSCHAQSPGDAKGEKHQRLDGSQFEVLVWWSQPEDRSKSEYHSFYSALNDFHVIYSISAIVAEFDRNYPDEWIKQQTNKMTEM